MPTVLHRLAKWADERPSDPAQRYKVGAAWKTITAQELRDRVYWLTLFLESQGVKPTDIGALLSYNRPEWVQMELATLLLGAKSAGLYPNSNPKDIQYILNQTESSFISVQNKDYFQKIKGGDSQAALPEKLKNVIVFEGDASFSPLAVSFESALDQGKNLALKKESKTLNQYLSALNPTAPAFLIYTSGTTGNPKGAMLSHDNLVYTSDKVSQYWRLPVGNKKLFSFLPLCHVAEKLQNVGVGLSMRYCVSYCTKFENVSTELVEARPNLLLCVPRLWEKMMEGVLYKVKTGKGLKKYLAKWALGVGARVAEAKYSGQTPNPLDLLQYKLADALVLKKIRTALGLEEAKLLASGAAALGSHISKWFRSIGREILEDFGQTESTGVICMTETGVESSGTVGKPIPGMDFKIAEDGEVLTRGRHVFVGYFKDSDATAQALENGWLHTGDLAEINGRGLVQIRGRKKEILKTSGGKMVAPLPIEEKLKEAEMISQACMVGDGRKYLSVLITLTEVVLSELKTKNALSSGNVVSDPEVISAVKKYIDRLNGSLASYEQIKKFSVLNREFSVADGEMTPTLKMKRNVIEQRFQNVINSMY